MPLAMFVDYVYMYYTLINEENKAWGMTGIKACIKEALVTTLVTGLDIFFVQHISMATTPSLIEIIFVPQLFDLMAQPPISI